MTQVIDVHYRDNHRNTCGRIRSEKRYKGIKSDLNIKTLHSPKKRSQKQKKHHGRRYPNVCKASKPTKPMYTNYQIITDAATCKQAITKLYSAHPTFVGFDCEWRQDFPDPRVSKRRQKKNKHKHRISMIQICFKKTILLIRIYRFRNNIPKIFKTFLKDRNVYKCGIGLSGDKRKLKWDHGLELRGCVELNHVYQDAMYNDYGNAYEAQWLGLRVMCQDVLGRDMHYKSKVKHFYWEKHVLPAKYIQYAIDDCKVGYDIYDALTY
eukprot:534051_1